ncbi:potassium transporter Kup [Methylocaldum szegediense]|uniref:Probable potassium transport system protein Kup n=1 Tax=Methylocaldum szegediense TaxID=73780 RepID=A0ABN8XDB2_9GAMM|nr:potassium transporter Kup [Methylocaldum szegediense]CAI8954322.1 putative potassium transport system protein kup [Methylocaldum szegediense]
MNSVTLAPYPSHAQKSLILGALGIVFGNIGTSPLYALKQCFAGVFVLEPTPENILGVLSLIFWALLIVISLKYAIVIMRAHNKGEGGVMALITLIQQKAEIGPRLRRLLIGVGLVGASLFYGDGMITPAISVLSAVEGLEVLQPELRSYIVPLSLAILIGLFAFQRKGTAGGGALFRLVMGVWFFAIGAFGTLSLLKAPEVLAAANPAHAIYFLSAHGWPSVYVLGAVVLAVTGGEVLYADMGHFGRESIRKTWFLFVLPALMLNYFGQGALLIQNPSAIQNPFYLLVPEGMLAFMIVIATIATIVASQAIISATFALTSQAIQLGFCPRLGTHYTSEEENGQIYIPWTNWALMVATVILVLGFQSSSNLAAAYGVAVTGIMAVDTILALVVVYSLWKWNPIVSGLAAVGFITVDSVFLIGNATKIFEGGWLSLVIGLIAFTFLSTWKRGRDLLRENLREGSVDVDHFLAEITSNPPLRVAGTAVFMTSSRDDIPPALLHNLKHNKVLHETVVLMTVTTENTPRVAPEKRREIRRLGAGFFRINLHYGFMEAPNIPRALKSASREFDIDISDTTFFLSRETIIPGPTPKMPLWQLRLFIGMFRNTRSTIGFFRIPPDRVVELGVQRML